MFRLVTDTAVNKAISLAMTLITLAASVLRLQRILTQGESCMPHNSVLLLLTFKSISVHMNLFLPLAGFENKKIRWAN